jgi:hypothetical protein
MVAVAVEVGMLNRQEAQADRAVVVEVMADRQVQELPLSFRVIMVVLAMLVSHPAQVVVAQGQREEIQREKVHPEAVETVSHPQLQAPL